MGIFKYSLDLGGYDDDVRVNLDVTIKNGLLSSDYEVLRAALGTVEDIARKYIPEEEEDGEISTE